MSTSPPTLSVVVAARDAAAQGGPCAAEVVRQIGDRPIECLVVTATGRAAPADPTSPEPILRVIGATGSLVPELWAAGILASTGDIVALTNADCVPASGWIDAVLAAPWDRHAGVGGCFDVAPQAPIRDRATLYLRYSAYLPFGERREVSDIAADNAAYDRRVLLECRDAWEAGFWEVEVHHRFRGLGARLVFEPAMRVLVRHPGSAVALAGQRLVHGWWFGRQRRGATSIPARLLRIASAPLVPAVLLVRIGRSLRAAGRLSAGFFVVLPPLLAYTACWAFGEALGYLGVPPPGHRAGTAP